MIRLVHSSFAFCVHRSGAHDEVDPCGPNRANQSAFHHKRYTEYTDVVCVCVITIRPLFQPHFCCCVSKRVSSQLRGIVSSRFAAAGVVPTIHRPRPLGAVRPRLLRVPRVPCVLRAPQNDTERTGSAGTLQCSWVALHLNFLGEFCTQYSKSAVSSEGEGIGIDALGSACGSFKKNLYHRAL